MNYITVLKEATIICFGSSLGKVYSDIYVHDVSYYTMSVGTLQIDFSHFDTASVLDERIHTSHLAAAQ